MAKGRGDLVNPEQIGLTRLGGEASINARPAASVSQHALMWSQSYT